MPRVYFNNGHSFGNKDDDYVCKPGEAFLPEGATPAQIATAFPGHAAGDPMAPKPKTPAEKLAAVGLTVAELKGLLGLT